ncbi:hypothetical protein OMP40_20265 [Cohnella rhizosphaerae]|uniref:Uncharacterized protein n=1 Tax=Cohnella rhizosphaerae TaxID=1457232 RepID=A0A9X4KVF6_9BACL|nr:hypothetical protein [Cohnella rhizosphaerae]MDG0811443.1 hypothetical protein [Cohnella rhizosphaerae]
MVVGLFGCVSTRQRVCGVTRFSSSSMRSWKPSSIYVGTLTLIAPIW